MLDFGTQLSLKGEAILSVKGVGDHDLITVTIKIFVALKISKQ